MRALWRSVILAAAILAVVVQQAPAQDPHAAFAHLAVANQPPLLGTTGACENGAPGGPCAQTSTLVLLDPITGKLITKIGPVGFTVNGLAWDRTSRKLYASTSIGDTKFHGLITINPFTGAGTPVNPAATNFGIPLDPTAKFGGQSPIHSIAVDVFGHMVGWYEEFNGHTDTYVRINQQTGVATEFNDTGIDTSNNGVSFGEFNLLWNIDTTRLDALGTLIQNAYLINPFTGQPLLTVPLSPPTQAALGDFHPVSHLYYGLNFDTSFPPPRPTFIEVVNVLDGTIQELGQTVDDLHTLAFVPAKSLP